MTSVGGTSLAIGPRNNREWEIPWGMLIDPLAASGLSWTYAPPSPYNADTYDGSSGGGVSTAYTQLAPEPPPGTRDVRRPPRSPQSDDAPPRPSRSPQSDDAPRRAGEDPPAVSAYRLLLVLRR